jgi:hypothetical protein
MTPEKYKVHSELVYDLVTEKLLEAIAPYSVDVQFLMVADILTQITQDLMETRLSKISQKFFREKNMHI